MSTFVRLFKYGSSGDVALNYGIIPSNVNGDPERTIRRYDATVDYPANSFIVRDGEVYHTPHGSPAGPFNFAEWNNVEGLFALVQVFNANHSYKADSVMIHPRDEVPFYAKEATGPGSLDAAAWEPFAESEAAVTLHCYMDPDRDDEEPTVISGKCVEIKDVSLESSDYLDYFDGFYDATNPSEMAANVDGTGAVTNGSIVRWIRDLSGHGNHGIQTDDSLCPRWFAKTGGGGYLRFDPGGHFVVPTITTPTDHWVSVGGRGEAVFLGIDNDRDPVNPGAKLGMKNHTDTKAWIWSGEAISTERVIQEHEDFVLADLALLTAKAGGDLSPLGGMFENETRLFRVIPGFNTEGQSMAQTFKNCTIFTGGISGWDVRFITNFIETFYGCANFNEDIGSWQTDNLQLMTSTFHGAHKFNQNIGPWDVSKVRQFGYCFADASAFNNGGQPLTSWDVSSAQNMESMFSYAQMFDQELGYWDVSKVESMESMFEGAMLFNRDIGAWDISAVTNMDKMFSMAENFYQDISWWCADSIPSIPADFDTGSGFETESALQPNWGGCLPTGFIAIYEYDDPQFLGAATTGPGGITDGTKVAYVEDRSGNGNHATQTDVALQPVYREIEPGKGYLEFSNDAHLDCGTVTVSTHCVSAHTGRGAVRHTGIDNSAGLKAGIQFSAPNKVWTLTSQSFAETSVLQDDWDFEYDRRDAAVKREDIPASSTTASLFENEEYVTDGVATLVLPDLVDMSNMMKGCFRWNEDVDHWDVSECTDMTSAFEGCLAFNGTCGSWSVNKVTSFKGTFHDCKAFSQNISAWSTDGATDMSFMFKGTAAFNVDITGWSVSSVTTMESMFESAAGFNQDITVWDTAAVESFESMFKSSGAFDQDINNLDMTSALTLQEMFASSVVFDNGNQPLAFTAPVATSASMFLLGSVSFNQSIAGVSLPSAIDVSAFVHSAAIFNNAIAGFSAPVATDVTGFFMFCPLFNQDISDLILPSIEKAENFVSSCAVYNNNGMPVVTDPAKFNLANATTIRGFFSASMVFNQDVSGMDVSNIQDMSSVFGSARAFNQSLSTWDVTSCLDFSSMFNDALMFDQDLSSWDVSGGLLFTGMFSNATAFTGTGISGWVLTDATHTDRMFNSATAVGNVFATWDVTGKVYTDMFLDAPNVVDFPIGYV